ncbi:MAG: pilus assembly protein N-terminal domain-containing protein [Pirellulales bacterium]|nr:pilus assembly protein N-terminal domain-containing protein [Pirellulales bacterium]
MVALFLSRATARRVFGAMAGLLALCAAHSALAQQTVATQPLQNQAILFNVGHAPERLEMIVNTSRILTLDSKIPQAQVNNPEVLEVTPLSPTQIQVFAKKAGVTQVNLWDEQQQIHTIDVIVFGDARELAMLLETQFPNAALKVVPTANSVVISGYVDNPEDVGRIIQVSEDFYPKVINNIRVGGVDQILLHVKVMEVSRTKLRTLGFDFVWTDGSSFAASSIGGLLQSVSSGSSAITGLGQTASFGIVDSNSAFFGFLDALRENQLMKLLAEPDLVTVSGRPAFFNVGGEFPILVPQSLGTISIEYKKYGTQLDFVPIVLGNGNIRLEIRPRVSEIDNTRSVRLQDINVPALRVREVDTGAEMRAGQTMAIAGLLYSREEANVRQVPFLGEIPYLGVLFSHKRDEINEIELLVLVTPEIVSAMDAEQVPCGGPGMNSCPPSDCQFYLQNKIEVQCCPDNPCGHCQQCCPKSNPPSAGAGIGYPFMMGETEGAFIEDGGAPMLERLPAAGEMVPLPETRPLPREPMGQPVPATDRAAANHRRAGSTSAVPISQRRELPSPIDAPRINTAPSSRRGAQDPHNRVQRPQPASATPHVAAKPQSGVIGPLGYDLQN